MLKKIDLSKKLGKPEYKTAMSELGVRLSEAQRLCKDANVPVMVIFEGWSAAGKGSRIGSLIKWLDPRGFEVFTTQKPTEDERLRPYMWRFWRRTPAKGRIHVFDSSWYSVLTRSLEREEQPLSDPVRDTLLFEKLMVDSGVLIVKIFLHISEKEQKQRIKGLEKSPDTAWRVSKSDWEQNRKYDKWLKHYEQILQKTDHSLAKWHVVEANDARFADVKVLTAVVEAMEEAAKSTTENNEQNQEAPEAAAPDSVDVRSKVLESYDPNIQIDPEIGKRRLDEAQAVLTRLHGAMYRERVPAAVLFEGWDAAGKGGAIKRLVSPLDPRGYKVFPSGAPNDVERAHHYLWRYWNEVPKAGHLTVFDRSWYGRVMVERVEGFCTKEEWMRAFREINDFEEQLVDSGIILVKFWLHIDQEEQLRRFEDRMNTPEKNWKITDEDWRNREKWDKYLEAVDEMLLRTSTTYAPWTIVEAGSKVYSRVKVAETVQKRLQDRLEKKKHK